MLKPNDCFIPCNNLHWLLWDLYLWDVVEGLGSSVWQWNLSCLWYQIVASYFHQCQPLQFLKKRNGNLILEISQITDIMLQIQLQFISNMEISNIFWSAYPVLHYLECLPTLFTGFPSSMHTGCLKMCWTLFAANFINLSNYCTRYFYMV